MTAAAPPLRKYGKISGRLLELGRFGRRGIDVNYAFVKLERNDGDVVTLERVSMPGELNGLLEIGAPTTLFLARRGVWNFCYGLRSGESWGESYRGYRLYFIFNRLLMYLNLMFGAYLVFAPGLHWAGVGLLIFGALFAVMGPASPRRMRALLVESRSEEQAGPKVQSDTSG